MRLAATLTAACPREASQRVHAGVDEGAPVTLIGEVVGVDAEGKRSLLQFSDGSRAWLSWGEDMLIAASGDPEA